MKRLLSGRILAWSIGLCLAAAAPVAAAQTVSVYATGVVNAGGLEFLGSDLIATTYGGVSIRKVTPAGVVSNFASIGNGRGITLGGDGAYYATNGPEIVRITSAGVVTTFYTLAFSASSIVYNPVTGNFYVSEQNSTVYQLTPGGVLTSFAAASGVDQIAVAPDGTMYAASVPAGILQITTAGVVSTFAPPGTADYGVAVDGAGNVYGIRFGAGEVTKTTPAGITTTYATGLSAPFRATIQGDSLYVGSLGLDVVYRIDGVASSGATPTVPTLSEWAMILLALGLAGSAAVIVNRRRQAA